MDTKQSQCAREKVLLYVEGKLKGKERVEVEEHLRRCNNCHDYADFVRSLREVMQSLPEAEKESCPSSLVLALYTSGQLDAETEANVTAHILHCDDCFNDVLTLERMEEALVEKVEEPSLAESMGRLVVRVVQGILELVEASGQVFQGRELQPALVRLRGPQKELYHDYIVMTQKIGGGITIEIKVSGSEKKNVDISLVAYRMAAGNMREWVNNLEVTLKPEGGGPAHAAKTSGEGTTKLGCWGGQGSFTIEVNEAGRKIGEVYFELRKG